MKNRKGNIYARLCALSRMTLVSVFAGALMLMVTGVTQAAQPTHLKKSSFVALPGHKIEVKLDFDSAPPQPKSYLIDSPPRVVMDLWGVTSDLESQKLDIKTGQVDSLNFAQTKGRLRIVGNLNTAVDYRTYTQDNSLFIEFSGVAAQAKVPSLNDARGKQESVLDKADQERNSVAVNKQTMVRGIDFERADGGTGRVIISLSDDKAGLDISEEGNNIVVNLVGAGLSDALAQRLDVKDFATPVNFIDSMASHGNATILIKPTTEPHDYMAYQTGNQLIVNVKPLDVTKVAKNTNKFPYSGEKIDLNFQDVSVRSVLQIIAEVAKLNLVVSDDVDSSAGNITLRLKNVPWDQALDIILKNKGLDKRQVGNVLMVGTAQQIAEREKQELESQQQEKELAPLQTEFVQINFRRASDMKASLEAAHLISKRGFVLADDQTNVLMIRETANDIEQIRNTLRNFDVEVSQIMVESRIVTASRNFARDLGINWGFTQQRGSWSVGSNLSDTLSTTGNNTTSGMNVDLGSGSSAENSAASIALGLVRGNFALGAELAAMESSSQGEVIAQPKVITTNGKPALIKSGQEIPYVVTDDDGDQNTEFKDAVLSLEVTPQVNPGDRISMDLNITQDRRGETLDNGEIAIDTNQLTTSVVVGDGRTIVLGGIFQDQKTSTVYKVPLLGDIPFIGAAFRSKSSTDEKQELLIFVTPRLVRESISQ